MLKIYSDTEVLPHIPNPVVSLGTFDGVHFGHKAILDRLCKLAADNNGEPVILTFEPHPRIVLNKDPETLRLLNTKEEKAELLEKAGIKHLFLIRFTPEFANLSERQFIEQYLVNKIHLSKLVIGYNHRFGRNREGNFDSLVQLAGEYNFEVEEMPEQDVGGLSVSSTKIREAISTGNISMANEMLGYDYSISGKVAEGAKLGHTIGFPTANIGVENPYKLIPARGVYAVKVTLAGQRFGGMCNIGVKPTFDGKTETIEVNIFDFDTDIYKKELRVYFIERLRSEQKFGSIDQLIEQLKADRQHSLKILHQGNEKKT